MSQVYQEVYKEVRHQDQGEAEYLKDLHEKFDYYYDKEMMENKLPSEWFDLHKWDEQDDLNYTTDFTSETEDLLYKRYKLNYSKEHQSCKQYFEMVDIL